MDSTWTASLHSAPQLGSWLVIRSAHVTVGRNGQNPVALTEDSKNTAQARLVRSTCFPRGFHKLAKSGHESDPQSIHDDSCHKSPAKCPLRQFGWLVGPAINGLLG